MTVGEKGEKMATATERLQRLDRAGYACMHEHATFPNSQCRRDKREMKSPIFCACPPAWLHLGFVNYQWTEV